MFNNQGNSKPEASHSENGDMAKEWEELVELDDVELATVVGGRQYIDYGWTTDLQSRPWWQVEGAIYYDTRKWGYPLGVRW